MMRPPSNSVLCIGNETSAALIEVVELSDFVGSSELIGFSTWAASAGVNGRHVAPMLWVDATADLESRDPNVR